MSNLDQKIISLNESYEKAVCEVNELRGIFERSNSALSLLHDLPHPNNDVLTAIAVVHEKIKSRLPELQNIILQIKKEAEALDILLKFDHTGEETPQ